MKVLIGRKKRNLFLVLVLNLMTTSAFPQMTSDLSSRPTWKDVQSGSRIEKKLSPLKKKMEILKQYALSFVGTNYLWGGENPMSGFDCSGLVKEVLKSVGMIPDLDMSAQGLYEYFRKTGYPSSNSDLGAIVFFGHSVEHITHVGFAIDKNRMVEAGSGDSSTTSLDRAIAQNAYVRIRPISHRKDLVAVIMPDYASHLTCN